MFVHHRLPSRHVEPCVVRLHHPHRSAQLHGGERPHPRQHRDLRLHSASKQTTMNAKQGDKRPVASPMFDAHFIYFPEKTAVSPKPGLQPQG